jgi:N-acetylneuraminate synthase
VRYGATDAEKKSLVFRRSLYVAADMKAGEEFTATNLRIVRPGNGLHPRHYEQLLGKRVTRDLRKGTPVSWEMLS